MTKSIMDSACRLVVSEVGKRVKETSRGVEASGRREIRPIVGAKGRFKAIEPRLQRS